MATLLAPHMALAWFSNAHTAVGVLAVEQLDEPARAELRAVLGDTDDELLAAACNWPDEYDQWQEGQWSSPLHYVNLPPEALSYQRSRDCANRQCLPEALIHYAGRLADPALGAWERREAFAFVCHLVADLHQPLHVAYADDLGGSRIMLEFGEQSVNLHLFWDGVLIDRQVDNWQSLARQLRARPQPQKPRNWQAADVYAWTNETLSFTRNFAYPRQHQVDAEFARRSWQVILQQLDVAAGRLAAVLEASLTPATAALPADPLP